MKYHLHSCCFPVLGYLRGMIVDSQRGNFSYYPKEFIQIILDDGGYVNMDRLDPEFIDDLIKNDYVYAIPGYVNPGMFKPLGKNVNVPEDFTSVTIELGPNSNFLDHFFKHCNIRHIGIYINDYVPDSVFEHLRKSIENSPVHSVTLHISHSEGLDSALTNVINSIADSNRSVICLLPPHSNFAFNDKVIVRVVEPQVSPLFNLMTINLKHVLESIAHHPYFYRRLHISNNGSIHRFQGDSISFGNVTSFIRSNYESLFNNSIFTKYWYISRNEIAVCNQCEFRLICADNRTDLVELLNGEYAYLTECEYNPYIARWRHQEGYQNLSSSGVTLDRSGVTINVNHLTEIQRRIWDDC